MAREYAQIKLAIWSDDDWRDLTASARYLYLTLLTSPTLSHCGVADWRPARIGALNGMQVDEIYAAGEEMVESLHLVIDEGTEEVLIRSFVRNDGLMKQPKMATAMATAHAGVASQVIRGVVVHELNRLREDFPDLNGWHSERATNLLGLRSVDPSTYPLGKGSGKGKSNPSGKGSPTPAPTPAPTPSNLAPSAFEAKSSDKSAGRKRPATRLSDDWKPTDKHLERRKDGIDVEREAQAFRLHAEANDRRQANWNAAFSQWLLNARPSGNVRPDEPRRLPYAHEIERPPDGLSDEEMSRWLYEQRRKRAGA